jgi:hypothetical protein
MKTVLIAAVALLSAGSAQAESFYRCDRFNLADTYQVAIDTATGQAKFTGNKAGAVLKVVSTSDRMASNDSVLAFAEKDEGALELQFSPDRLEAVVSTVDIYGNREEIGEGVCQQVEAI